MIRPVPGSIARDLYDVLSSEGVQPTMNMIDRLVAVCQRAGRLTEQKQHQMPLYYTNPSNS